MRFNEMHRRLALLFLGAALALFIADLTLPGIIGTGFAGLGCTAAGAALLALGYEGKK